MNLIRHVLLILVSLCSSVFAYFLKIICFIHVVLLQPAQPAVRAALEGRVLVLEGMEKAERNVLPVLNNLLENREMQLDDGRLIVAPLRYDQLYQVCVSLVHLLCIVYLYTRTRAK